MTTNNAGPTCGPFGVINRVGPVAKWDLEADMLVLVASVRAVAGDAGTTLFHVNMKIVQIVFAVSEICQSGGEFFLGDILIVAAEAEIVLTRFVFAVEISWKVADEQFCKL